MNSRQRLECLKRENTENTSFWCCLLLIGMVIAKMIYVVFVDGNLNGKTNERFGPTQYDQYGYDFPARADKPTTTNITPLLTTGKGIMTGSTVDNSRTFIIGQEYSKNNGEELYRTFVESPESTIGLVRRLLERAGAVGLAKETDGGFLAKFQTAEVVSNSISLSQSPDGSITLIGKYEVRSVESMRATIGISPQGLVWWKIDPRDKFGIHNDGSYNRTAKAIATILENLADAVSSKETQKRTAR